MSNDSKANEIHFLKRLPVFRRLTQVCRRMFVRWSSKLLLTHEVMAVTRRMVAKLEKRHQRHVLEKWKRFSLVSLFCLFHSPICGAAKMKGRTFAAVMFREKINAEKPV